MNDQQYTEEKDQSMIHSYPSSYREDLRTRELIRDEMRKAGFKKPSFFKTLALVFVGAIIGGLISFSFLSQSHRMGDNPSKPASSGQEQEKMEISIKEDSTVENAVAKKCLPSIVGITTIAPGMSQNPFLFGIPQYSESVGSGIILSKDGYILTNAHVIDSGKSQKMTVLLNSKEEKQAQLIWADPTLDLAVIKISASGLQPIEFAKSDLIQVGDKAIAIGNPLGLDLQSTLTSGYISGLNRSITLQDGNVMDGLLQTDAAINSGNSGGALLNAEGKLIGVNSAKPSSSEGIGFAIPISTVRPIVTRILESGSYKPLYLGVTGYNVETVNQLSQTPLSVDSGVVVRSVMKGSPAEAAGIKKDDIILRLDEKSVDSMNALKTLLLKYKIEDKATLTVLRKGKEEKMEIIFKEFIPQEDQ